MPPQSASIDFKQGTAAFRLSNLSIPDWGSLRYATTGGPNTPSVVSFDARWSGINDRLGRSQAEQKWQGEYLRTTATIEWSVRQEGFNFKSDPRDTSKSQAAVIGRHRNGVFFS
ncbi:MAG TPA: hypothetical protein VIH59_20160 [Candidatus Tectomicrobia bacterium]